MKMDTLRVYAISKLAKKPRECLDYIVVLSATKELESPPNDNLFLLHTQQIRHLFKSLHATSYAISNNEGGRPNVSIIQSNIAPRRLGSKPNPSQTKGSTTRSE